MRKLGSILVLLLVASFCLVGAEPPILTPWSSPPLPPLEFSALDAALQELESLLADPSLGCQRSASGDAWGSASFATYTGGVLAERGYTVRLATGAEWQDGAHAWLLVQISTPTTSLWVPVEATPAPGARQQNLGMIPMAIRSATAVSFDERYAAFSRVEELPTNRPPVASLRLHGLSFTILDTMTLLGFGSYDPDDEIVLYRWKVGDTGWFSTRSSSAVTTLSNPGTLQVTLQVIDSRGASSFSTLTVKVADLRDPMEQTGGGCGCGG